MKNKKMAALVVVGLVAAWAPAAHVDAQTQGQPTVQVLKPGVPEVMTMEADLTKQLEDAFKKKS